MYPSIIYFVNAKTIARRFEKQYKTFTAKYYTDSPYLETDTVSHCVTDPVRYG